MRTMEGMEVEGHRLLGRPKKTWRCCIRQDKEKLGIGEDLALDKGKWMRASTQATPT